MADREKVIEAIENCIGKPKCRDCPWEDCDYEHEVINSVPYGLMRDALALLKEQDDTINELQNAYEYLQKQFFEVQDKLLKEQEKRIKDLQDHCDIRRSVKLNV